MDRRSYLGGTATALALGLAGCVTSLAPGTDDDRWAGVEPTYPDGRDVPAGAATHHLYVENADEETHPLEVTVVRTDGDGETLVWRAGYEAPDGRGFEVPDLLVEGRTYRVTVALADGDQASTTREIDDCPHEGGSRNLGAWIEGAAVSFRQDNCDEIIAGARLPTGDHRSFLDG